MNILYSLAFGEAIDTDFPTFRLCGKCWRRGEIPYDPYYFGDIASVRAGVFYPINILFSWISSFLSLDAAWLTYLTCTFLHSLATGVFAYFLFGQGLPGLFGAVSWSFCAYHVKTTLWYTETFTWITATLAFTVMNMPFWAGISLGMLLLAGHPPLVLYFMYLYIPFCLIMGFLPNIFLSILLGGYQWIKYAKYAKRSVRRFQSKTDPGNLPWAAYILMVVPLRYRGWISNVGPEEWCPYIGPVVVCLALFSNLWQVWLLVFLSIMLSTGGWLFRSLSKGMSRFPSRWGYFAQLAMVVLSVDGFKRLYLNPFLAWILIILTVISLLPNLYLYRPYPFAQYPVKPSEAFNTPLLKYLEANLKHRHHVNNLPYPVYTGQINHLGTLGYTGGNHEIDMNTYFHLPIDGVAPFNYFDYQSDSPKVESTFIKYHVGAKAPSDNTKWRKVDGLDLWENTNV